MLLLSILVLLITTCLWFVHFVGLLYIDSSFTSIFTKNGLGSLYVFLVFKINVPCL